MVTLPSLPCVKLPTESAMPDPENNGNVGPSQSICGHVGTVREPLTGHLGPDIYSSSWHQAGAWAKWAQGGPEAATVWQALLSVVCTAWGVC